jgi:hypothetical protein
LRSAHHRSWSYLGRVWVLAPAGALGHLAYGAALSSLRQFCSRSAPRARVWCAPRSVSTRFHSQSFFGAKPLLLMGFGFYHRLIFKAELSAPGCRSQLPSLEFHSHHRFPLSESVFSTSELSQGSGFVDFVSCYCGPHGCSTQLRSSAAHSGSCLRGCVRLSLQPCFSVHYSSFHHPSQFDGFLGRAREVFDEMHVRLEEL